MLEEKIKKIIDSLQDKHISKRNEATALAKDDELPSDLREEGLHIFRCEIEVIKELYDLQGMIDISNKPQFISRRVDELLSEMKIIIMEKKSENSNYEAMSCRGVRYLKICIEGFLDFLKKTEREAT